VWPQVSARKWAEQAGKLALFVPDPHDESFRLCFADLGSGLLHGTKVRRPGDPQSDDAPPPSGRRSIHVVDFTTYTSRLPDEPSVSPATGTEDDAPDADTVLARLRRPPAGDAYGRVVIDAEAVDFTGPQSTELRTLLRRFILRQRSSSDANRLTEVGSAVRKYVAELPAGELDEVAAFLDDNPAEEVELEVAKMVTRKLVAVPPAREGMYPALADRLVELVEAYIPPRHLRRPICAAILLNSALASALIEGPGWPRTLEWLRTMTVGWFQQQLARRARRLVADFHDRPAGDPAGRLTTALTELTRLH